MECLALIHSQRLLLSIVTLHEDVLQQLFGDEPVRPCRVQLGSSVEPRVDWIQLFAEVAAHVEPPITDEDSL